MGFSVVKVLMLGRSGAGKSTTGNYLLMDRRATAGKIHFKPAKQGKTASETQGITTRKNTYTDGDGNVIELQVTDPPGFGDTMGKSKKHLDEIMSFIKREKPHVIMYFVNGSSGSKITKPIQHEWMSVKECMKSSFSDTPNSHLGNLYTIITKLPAETTNPMMGGSGNGGGRMRQINNVTKSLKEHMGLSVDERQLLLIPHDPNGTSILTDPIFAFRDNVLLQRGHTPVNCSGWRTFSTVKQQAVDYRANKISLVESTNAKIKNYDADIKWHENRIRDLSIACAATGWIPYAGQTATIGMSIAISDSQHKLIGLRSKLNDLKSNNSYHHDEKMKAEEWLDKILTLEKTLET